MSYRLMKLELGGYIPEMNAIQCGLRLNRSYQTLLNMHPWSFLKRSALVNLVAPYITGTITVATGGTTVTGIGTAWTAGMAGRFIRLSTQFEYYLISSVDPIAQTLVIESAASVGVTASAYTIFQRLYPKPTNAKHVINVVRELMLTERTQEWLDSFDPDRFSTGPPIVWSNYDDDTLEIYPPADQAYTVKVNYKIAVADMALEADVPVISENLIVLHAAAAAYRMAGSRPEGQNYIKLLPGLMEEFKNAWTAEFETDLNRQTLPEQVTVDGGAMPTSVEFWISKDDFWSGR